jgi:hypothetical protein
MKVVERTVLLSAVLMSVTTAGHLGAQACHGSPRGGAIAYELGAVPFGESSHGATLSLGGGGTAIGASFRMTEYDPGVSGMDAGFRFSLVLGKPGPGLSICPGVGLIFERTEAELNPGKVTGTSLGGRGNLGVGYTFPEYRGFTVAPFLLGALVATATRYQTDVPNVDEEDEAGDVRTRFELELGGIVRFKQFYVGWAQNRDLEQGPYLRRFIFGFAFAKSGS